MAIIRMLDRQPEIVDDDFVHLDDADAVAPDSKVIVSLMRWHAHRVELLEQAAQVGVRIEPDDEPEVLVPHLGELAVIAVAFPKFTDGRGYTKARLLRERWRYKGQLRAIGHVLRDQLFYMHRCGFDAFELAPGKSLQEAVEGFRDFSVTYQGAADDPRPLFRRRAAG